MFKNLISRFRQRGVKADPPPRRRDDSGLTTLEWLLIVAAVAGLAALAVVLVQNVVSDTSEQIEGSSARLTAAQVAAADIEEDAKVFDSIAHDPAALTADVWATWEREYSAKCRRIEITYADAGLTVTPGFEEPTGTGLTNPLTGVTFGDTAATATAVAKCEVTAS